MPVITINGPTGSGAIEIGQMVAQRLHLNYVDRLVFAEAAKLVRMPVGALIAKEQRVDRFRDRLARFLDNMLERSSAMGDHDFGFGIETLPETYTELFREPPVKTQQVNDKAFIEATAAVVRDLYRTGNVVIIGRGANVVLADFPGALHVGMLGPPELRVDTIMQREHLDRRQAQTYVEELEAARVKFFRKFFKVNPNDPGLYHLMLNMGYLSTDDAVEIITSAATDRSQEPQAAPV